MGKCIITIEDQEDGGVHMHSEFDPPLDKTGKRTPTVAQLVGYKCAADVVELLMKMSGEETDG